MQKNEIPAEIDYYKVPIGITTNSNYCCNANAYNRQEARIANGETDKDGKLLEPIEKKNILLIII